MPEQIHSAINAASECVDTRTLSEQLGSAEELTTLSPIACAHQLNRIHSLPALRDFLVEYANSTLGPREFPAIVQAWDLAGRNYIRELLALDRDLASNKDLREFEMASRAVGKRQLNRMRPLKDMRVIQRYREAVNEGTAYGWHTLVYGLVLSTYSLPLRQGLLHYGRQTLGGFIHAAARTLDLSHTACLELQLELSNDLRPQVEKVIAASSGSALFLT